MYLNGTKYELKYDWFAIRIEDQLVGVKKNDTVKFIENRVEITDMF